MNTYHIYSPAFIGTRAARKTLELYFSTMTEAVRLPSLLFSFDIDEIFSLIL